MWWRRRRTLLHTSAVRRTTTSSCTSVSTSAMAFIKRLMDHMLNQVLVETLANSRWFQRFAVYTHKLTKEAADRSKDHSNLLDEHVSSIMEKSKAFTSKLREDFAQELKKLQEVEAQQQKKKR